MSCTKIKHLWPQVTVVSQMTMHDDASARSGTFDSMERSVLSQVTVHLKFSGVAQ